MTHVFESSDFPQIGTELKGIVSATWAPGAPLVRGPHCEKKFCSLRHGGCPLWKRQILEIPDGKNVAAYLEGLSPTDRGEFMSRIETILHVATHCKETCNILAVEHGFEFGGYEVGPGRNSYVCSSDATFRSSLEPFAAAKGITVDKLFTPPVPALPKSKSDVEKLLGKGKVVAEVIKSLYAVVPGKPTLKDRR
jgi:hypothetical protein